MNARLPLVRKNAHVGLDAAPAMASGATNTQHESVAEPLWVIASATSYLAWGIIGSVVTGLSYFAAKADFRRVLEAVKSGGGAAAPSAGEKPST